MAVLLMLGVGFYAARANWLTAAVERVVTWKTGREFSVSRLDFKWGWPPWIVAHDIRLANPDWARDRDLLQIRQASFSVDLLRLATGTLWFPDVWLEAPRVNLEIRKGQPTWLPDATPPADEVETSDGERLLERTLFPVVDRLRAEAGVLRFFDPARQTDIEVKLSSGRNDGNPGVRFSASGTFRSVPVSANGEGAPILAVVDKREPYPLQAQFSLGQTRGKVDGTLTPLVGVRAADIALDLEGDSIADLFTLAKLALPPSPPYRIKGRLVRKDAQWQMKDFIGRVGDSDLSGDVTIRYREGRPYLEADLKSQRMDLDDFGGVIGALPQTGAGETASAEQRAEAREAADDPKLLPREPVKLERLRAMDAKIHFRGKHLHNRRTPLEDVELRATLKDGVVEADPLNFGVAGGDIRAQVTMDGRKATPKLRGAVKFRRLELGKLFPAQEQLAEATGVIGGQARFEGSGASFAEVLADSDGTLGLAMRGGKISNLWLEIVGLDGAEIVKFLFGGDREVLLRCGVADLEFRSGVVRPRALVLDTADTNIHATGQVDLRSEAIDLVVRPMPKDFSPLTLRSPLHVFGTLKEPRVVPDGSLMFKGSMAALLGTLVNPLVGLLPLIESGPGKDEDCAALVQTMEQRTAVSLR